MLQLLSFLALLLVQSALSGDPLRELGQFMYCQGREEGTFCDSAGAFICRDEKCRSVCSELDRGKERFTQCTCPGDPASSGGCRICCRSYGQFCAPLANLSDTVGTTPYGVKAAFCPDPCPFWASGRPCALGAGLEGMCHRGRCRDPCTIIGDMQLCSGSGPCAEMGAKFCCKKKDEPASECRVDDDWHFKLKRRIQKNSRAPGVHPGATLALAVLLVTGLM